MKTIKSLNSSNNDINFYGYGGEWMKKEGFNQQFDFNIENLYDKTFHTYRRSRTMNEVMHYKWNPFNLVNAHYMRNAN